MLIVEVIERYILSNIKLRQNVITELAVNLSLSEFTAIRKRVGEFLPEVYATTSPLNFTATGMSHDIMVRLGWVQPGDREFVKKKCQQIIVGDKSVLANSLFGSLMALPCRVTHEDGVKLNRRKHFKDQTYRKWRAEGGEYQPTMANS